MTRFSAPLCIQLLACIARGPADGAAHTRPAGPIRSGTEAAQTTSTRLEPGQPVARTIAAGETHLYRLALRESRIASRRHPARRRYRSHASRKRWQTARGNGLANRH